MIRCLINYRAISYYNYLSHQNHHHHVYQHQHHCSIGIDATTWNGNSDATKLYSANTIISSAQHMMNIWNYHNSNEWIIHIVQRRLWIWPKYFMLLSFSKINISSYFCHWFICFMEMMNEWTLRSRQHICIDKLQKKVIVVFN